MEKRFMVIKDKCCGIVIKGWFFDLSLLDDVTKQAPQRFEDFCRMNKLDKNNFFWEITK